MTYEEFKVLVERDIKDYLPESYQDAEVQIISKLNPNDVRVDSLCVCKPGADYAPSIKLGEFYQQLYGRDSRFPHVMSMIADLQMEADKKNSLNVNTMKEWASNKDKLLSCVETQLINKNRSREMLAAVPHTIRDEWAFCYYVPMEVENMDMLVRITNEIQSLSGVSVEELHEAAMANTQANNPVSLEQTPLSIFSPVPMYILSNQQKSFGAAALFYPGVMEDMTEKMGGDYVVLPSSVHEVLLIPYEERLRLSECSEMVENVNQQMLKEGALKPEEVLGDGAFYYDSLEKRLMTVGEKIYRDIDKKMKEQVQAEKEQQKKKEMKPVLKRTPAPPTARGPKL